MKKTTQETRRQLRDELRKAQEAIDDLNTLNRGLQYTIQNEQAKNKTLKDSLKVSVYAANPGSRDVNIAVRVSGEMLDLLECSPEEIVQQAYAMLQRNIRHALREKGIGAGGNR